MNRINTPTKPPNITMTAAEFDEFVDSNLNFLRSLLADKPEGIMPHFFVQTVDMKGESTVNVFVIAGGFNDFEEKKKILQGIGQQVYANKEIPVVVALACEAWVATNPPKGTMPRDCPNKREVLLVAAKDFAAKHSKLVTIPVKRDANNKMQAADEPSMKGEDGKLQSPILDHFFRGFSNASHNRQHRN